MHLLGFFFFLAFSCVLGGVLRRYLKGIVHPKKEIQSLSTAAEEAAHTASVRKPWGPKLIWKETKNRQNMSKIRKHVQTLSTDNDGCGRFLATGKWRTEPLKVDWWNFLKMRCVEPVFKPNSSLSQLAKWASMHVAYSEICRIRLKFILKQNEMSNCKWKLPPGD